ncbi:uncharacterized protein [Littorina saxatilis]|uniref:uncharacterized protein n=1 Tax=Littorina saxatilis TaxID=31220 RepID=UPI0038B4E574
MAEQSRPALKNGDSRGSGYQDDVTDGPETDERGDTDKIDGPEFLQAPPVTPARNEYTSRKALAHAMMDAALLMANISQLRMLLAARGDNTTFFVPLLGLIVFSISCQFFFAVLILVIWARESRVLSSRSSPTTIAPTHHDRPDNIMNNNNGTEGRRGTGAAALLPQNPVHDYVDTDDAIYDVTTQRIHLLTVVLVFVITVTNMFITGLGFEPAGSAADHETQ